VDVEEHEVGTLLSDPFDRLLAVARLPDDADTFRLGEEPPELVAGQALVVDEDDRELVPTPGRTAQTPSLPGVR